MYCIHCGIAGAAAFCPGCGKSQKLPSDSNIDPKSDAVEAIDRSPAELPTNDTIEKSSIDWTQTLNYQAVLSNPEARMRIADANRGTTQGLTAEDLLKIFDAVSPLGVSLEKLSETLLPICDKIGIKVQRASGAIFQGPPGRVLLATLCAISSNGLEISEAHQQSEECGLIAKIPYSLYTNPGELLASLRVNQGSVIVQLEARIIGQVYDWGKSKRLIAQLLQSIHNDLIAQTMVVSDPRKRVA